jgi:hypothetical protein
LPYPTEVLAKASLLGCGKFELSIEKGGIPSLHSLWRFRGVWTTKIFGSIPYIRFPDFLK